MAKPLCTYRKTLFGFVPVSDDATEFHGKTKLGQEIRLDGSRSRSVPQHRLFWKMLSVVAENSEAFDNAEGVHLAIKAALGHGKWIDVGGSRPLFIPDSTGFAAMKQDEFQRYFDEARTVVRKYWLKVEDEELLNALNV